MDIIIGQWKCFVDKNYKNTIAITTMKGGPRDLFRWDKKYFNEPRGTDRNTLNVPMEIVIEAFERLDVQSQNAGKKSNPIRKNPVTTTNTRRTSKVANPDVTNAMLEMMIQQERINQEKHTQTQQRLEQLSQQNVMLMQMLQGMLGADVGEEEEVEEIEIYNIDQDIEVIDETNSEIPEEVDAKEESEPEKEIVDHDTFTPDESPVDDIDDDIDLIPPRQKKLRVLIED